MGKILFYLLIFIVHSTLTLSGQTIKVGYSDWPPFQYDDSNGNPAGLDIELIKAISNRAGLKVEFIKYPWPRVLQNIKNGILDIGMSATITPERAEFVQFSDTYFRLGYNSLFIDTSLMEEYSYISSLKDLIDTDLRIGVQIGAIYSEEYNQLIINENFKNVLEEVSDNKLNVLKLINGRINGFLCGEISGTYQIKEAGADKKISMLMYLYDEEEAKTFLLYSKKSMSQSSIDKINAAIKDLRRDGSFANIINPYLLQ